MIFDSYDNIYKEFELQMCTYNKAHALCARGSYAIVTESEEPEFTKQACINELISTSIFKLLTKFEADLKKFSHDNKNSGSYKQRLNEICKLNTYLTEDKREKAKLYIKNILKATCNYIKSDLDKDTNINIKILEDYIEYRNWYAHGQKLEEEVEIVKDVLILKNLCCEFEELIFNPQNT